jgi:hypothetical protein
MWIRSGGREDDERDDTAPDVDREAMLARLAEEAPIEDPPPPKLVEYGEPAGRPLPPDGRGDPLAALYGMDPGSPGFEEIAAILRQRYANRRAPRIGGCTRRIVGITDIAFDVDSNATQELPLGDPLEALDWGLSGTLVVRVHAVRKAPSATTSVNILLQQFSISADEPARLFVGAEVATVTLTNAISAPSLHVAAFTLPAPDHLRVVLRVDEGANLAPIDIALSVDLTLRPS